MVPVNEITAQIGLSVFQQWIGRSVHSCVHVSIVTGLARGNSASTPFKGSP